jgi:hypothetical protein
MTASINALREIVAQSHSLRSRLEEELLERERPSTIEPYQWRTSTTSGHFHHIDIDSLCSIPLAGRGSVIRAAETTRGEARPARYGRNRFGYVRIEGEIRMFDWEKSSGVDAPRKKIVFLAPRPSGVF